MILGGDEHHLQNTETVVLYRLCCTGLKYNEWIIVSCEIHEHKAGKFRVSSKFILSKPLGST